MNESWRETLVNASRPVRITASIALSMLAIFLLVMTIDGLHNWGQPDTRPTKTITVSGEGKAVAVPDTATISFTAQATAADVATAQKTMTESVDKALASIKDAGVSKDDVTTSSYNVSPHYEYTRCTTYSCPPSTSKVTGYDVSETVQVKIRKTDKVATVLDGLAKAGVQNVSGPNFVIDNPQKVTQDARGEAIKNAKTNAETLAKQLGVHLGKVVDFSENAGSYPRPMYEAKAAGVALDAAMPQAAPSIPVGQNEYNETVSITYEIH
jgi:uncharacterized protein YggE